MVTATRSAPGPTIAANPFLAIAPPPLPLVLRSAAWAVGVFALAGWSFRIRKV